MIDGLDDPNELRRTAAWQKLLNQKLAEIAALRTENRQLTANLTAVQTRCTELLETGRDWRTKAYAHDRAARYLRRILEELAEEACLPVDDLPGIARAFRGRDGAHQRAKAMEARVEEEGEDE